MIINYIIGLIEKSNGAASHLFNQWGSFLTHNLPTTVVWDETCSVWFFSAGDWQAFMRG